MKREPCRPFRRAVRLAALALAALAAGCSFVEDEFTWLDRAAPSTQVPPGAPPSGVAGNG